MLAGVVAAGSFGSAQAFGPVHVQKDGPSRWARAVSQTANLVPDARIVVLDIGSGHLLASSHLAGATEALATPGSTLKPLVLYFALASGRWDPERRVACSRQLHVGNHQLNCSHPAADPMNAEQALTWSCNSYFAELAGTLSPAELRSALSVRGLLAATGLAPGESVAAFREPRTREQVQLAALGVEGIRVTLAELAEAYRSLAVELTAHPKTRAAEVVRAGLADSASFGMAGAASLGGVPVAGKTGTASAESGGVTHGWFVGLAPAESPRVVVAVYVPTGRGSDAAQVAANVLAGSPMGKP
jgi:peptidoglycan glycosyltransferase